VALSSFGGKHMHLFLRKHADRLREDVLQSDEDEGQGVCGGGGEAGGPEAGWPLQRSSLARQPKPNLPESSSHLCPGRAPPRLLAAGKGSLWSKVSSWTGGSGVAAPAVEGEERETIHVFTVASGHMYERLQKIMVLSAIKRTPARIKFWFIKNYMSPQVGAGLALGHSFVAAGCAQACPSMRRLPIRQPSASALRPADEGLCAPHGREVRLRLRVSAAGLLPCRHSPCV
jgi:UDP-glucose:glycoprotein glucosyltransferase